jgi:hypothetical protein
MHIDEKLWSRFFTLVNPASYVLRENTQFSRK